MADENKRPEGDAALPPWKAIAVFGSWHPDVPQGKCLIYATRGGSLMANAPRRKYLAPASYSFRGIPFELEPTDKNLEEVS